MRIEIRASLQVDGLEQATAVEGFRLVSMTKCAVIQGTLTAALDEHGESAELDRVLADLAEKDGWTIDEVTYAHAD